MNTTIEKLVEAGFTVIRRGDARQPIIKKATLEGEIRNVRWVIMERFETKAARDRRVKELEADPKVIIDDFSTPAPYWDDERAGVVIPPLGIVLDAKNLIDRAPWPSARTMCAAAGVRMFTKSEAHFLMWQKDAINAILKEHDGDPLDGWFWTDTEDKDPDYSATDAWCAIFGPSSLGSSNFGRGYKRSTFIVRTVAAL